VAPQIVFVNSGKIVSHKMENAQELAHALFHLYFHYLHFPAAVLPEWVPYIIAGDKEKLTKQIKQSLSDTAHSTYSDYCKWAFPPPEFPHDSTIIHLWQGLLKETYGKLFVER
jgi:hypothetical protein